MDKNTLLGLKKLFTTYNDSVSRKEKIKTILSYLTQYTYLFLFLILSYLSKDLWIGLSWVLLSQGGLCGLFMYINFLILKYKLHTRIITCFRIMNFVYLFFMVPYTMMISFIFIDAVRHGGGEAVPGIILFIGVPTLIIGLVALSFGILAFRQLEKYRKSLKIQSVNEAH